MENFVGTKFYCPHAFADGNQCSRIREKTFEFFSIVLPTMCTRVASSTEVASTSTSTDGSSTSTSTEGSSTSTTTKGRSTNTEVASTSTDGSSTSTSTEGLSTSTTTKGASTNTEVASTSTSTQKLYWSCTRVQVQVPSTTPLMSTYFQLTHTQTKQSLHKRRVLELFTAGTAK